jgi:hypothetical protein
MLLSDSTVVKASAPAIFRFFEDMENHYLQWHPDHVLFRWVQGRGVVEGHVFYFEEYIAGKLLKKEVVFVRVVRDRYIEFAPTFWLMRLFLPKLLFRIEPQHDGTCRFVAEIHLRMGPLAQWLNRRELAAVREHMRVEGVNLRRIVEAQGSASTTGSVSSTAPA